MVTLDEPDESTLPRRTALSATESVDNTPLMLPTCTPALIDTRNDPATPDPVRHITDVSDPHAVLSHEECEAFPAPVFAASPMPDPCSVKMVDPVAA
jgi:hypothetical protein